MRVVVVFTAVTRNWLRSRSGLFFSFLFPVILLLVLGDLVGSQAAGQSVGPDPSTYYLSTLTAAFIMTNGVIGLTNSGSELRRSGVLKHLSATPLTRLEWLLGNILSQTVLALTLAGVMLVLGFFVYHAAVQFNLLSLGVLALGAILFSGVGMTLAGLVKDPEAASGLGNVIAFPMMLLSGTFWPVTSMPWYLESVSRVLPLTYFTDGLRSSMSAVNTSGTLADLAVMAASTMILISIGSLATRWKDA